MDWDKLRIFHAAAEAGSFTHAGETLGLSQSAVSRQVGALEHDLGAPLFHRHARGLILTEQGEMLHAAVHDVVLKLDAVRSRLIDSREKPHGDLRVTTTLALGANWLAPRLGEFVELYPGGQTAAAAVRRRTRPRHARGRRGAAPARADAARPDPPPAVHRAFPRLRLDRLPQEDGQPRTIADLDQHRLVAFGAPTATHFLYDLNSLLTVGRDPKNPPRLPHIAINNIAAIIRAVEHGVGIAVLPDYCVQPNSGLVAAAAAGRHAGNRLLSRLCRGDEERRPRSGVPRLPRLQGAALALLTPLPAHM